MKKIAIITLPGYFNYGNRLQNFALHKFITYLSKDNFVESIWFENNELKVYKKYGITFKNIWKYIFNGNNFRKFVNKGSCYFEVIREYNFKKFTDKYINTKFVDIQKTNLNLNYNYFVVGSD